ncbi:phosphoserine phosphatase SerB [Fulvimarina sp. 2208YS6-2-32]|uniref:Phosphoserine phosphatase n=1 Tax=Fulvimarina uroteuthidis TaxID=3098149 RepID=A0ABU5HYJ3_9HYPH|nr:phosphoserine phosphatase SerB [Fulvimarina sp. 2208YS6-2-32]MDY8108193.1 phosphoserine phosphatase SerB [Fulvimarina sp. 2208YS6-2-32]
MFVVTLIAPPLSSGLDAGLKARIGDVLGHVFREDKLHETHASDLMLDREPLPGAWEAARELADRGGIDAVLQRTGERRKSILIADMDSTMIDQECIDELAAEIGAKDAVSKITARAMNGEIEFESALRERVALLQGLSETVIGTVISQRITLSKGGAQLVATMRANGAYTALVSGGFTAFTGVIAERLGFDENRANVLLIENGMLTGKVAEPILGSDAKVAALIDIAGMRGVDMRDALAVGDGANDLGMIALAGAGVALHAKPSVAQRAEHRISHGDLTALLYMQGYRADEFSDVS